MEFIATISVMFLISFLAYVAGCLVYIAYAVEAELLADVDVSPSEQTSSVPPFIMESSEPLKPQEMIVEIENLKIDNRHARLFGENHDVGWN